MGNAWIGSVAFGGMVLASELATVLVSCSDAYRFEPKIATAKLISIWYWMRIKGVWKRVVYAIVLHR